MVTWHVPRLQSMVPAVSGVQLDMQDNPELVRLGKKNSQYSSGTWLRQ